MRALSLVLALLVSSLSLLPVRAWADHIPNRLWVATVMPGGYVITETIDLAGNVDAHGTVVLRPAGGAGQLVLHAEDASVNWADADGDGIAGLTDLTILFRDVRTGARVVGTLRPHIAEIEESGRYPATLQVSSTAVSGEMRVILRSAHPVAGSG